MVFKGPEVVERVLKDILKNPFEGFLLNTVKKKVIKVLKWDSFFGVK